ELGRLSSRIDRSTLEQFDALDPGTQATLAFVMVLALAIEGDFTELWTRRLAACWTDEISPNFPTAAAIALLGKWTVLGLEELRDGDEFLPWIRQFYVLVFERLGTLTERRSWLAAVSALASAARWGALALEVAHSAYEVE